MVNLTAITIQNGIPTGGNGQISTVDSLIQTAEITVTPTVTASNNYGTNFVCGGLLTFSNAFQGKGSGIIQSARVTVKKVESSGFTLFLFNANPSNSTWTDAAAAAINASDITKVLPPISFAASSALGTHTVLANTGIGYACALGASNTTLYGILLTNATLTNQFSSTSDVTVGVTILQDGSS